MLCIEHNHHHQTNTITVNHHHRRVGYGAIRAATANGPKQLCIIIIEEFSKLKVNSEGIKNSKLPYTRIRYFEEYAKQRDNKKTKKKNTFLYEHPLCSLSALLCDTDMLIYCTSYGQRSKTINNTLAAVVVMNKYEKYQLIRIRWEQYKKMTAWLTARKWVSFRVA
uniref:Uncharacterized protein n=1 Tax=Glossina austeni TaxID=7395 RepID=A0A1A9VC51_GLOAU